MNVPQPLPSNTPIQQMFLARVLGPTQLLYIWACIFGTSPSLNYNDTNIVLGTAAETYTPN